MIKKSICITLLYASYLLTPEQGWSSRGCCVVSAGTISGNKIIGANVQTESSLDAKYPSGACWTSGSTCPSGMWLWPSANHTSPCTQTKQVCN